MSSVLRHVKAIKLSAYETSIAKTACELRDQEIFVFRRYMKQFLIVIIVTNNIAAFLSLLTVIAYTLVSRFVEGGTGLSTAKLFTVVATIALLAYPLRSLGQQLGAILSAWASFKRIEEFLLSEEKYGASSTSSLPEKEPVGAVEIRITDAEFGVRDKIAILHDINIQLTDPSLWMLVGRVGSVSGVRMQTDAVTMTLSGQINSIAESIGRDGPTQRTLWHSPRYGRVLFPRSLAPKPIDPGEHHIHVSVRRDMVSSGYSRNGTRH